MRQKSMLTILVLLLLPCVVSWVQDEPRLALVIGNSVYAHFDRLRNPANDASDMGRTLETLDFEVTSLIDAGFEEMDEAVYEFGRRLAAEGGVGLFYYAGHGIEVGGVNYLIPVDARIRAEDEVQFRSVPVDQILAKMETARNGTNIVILDACRDNPLPASARSAGSSRGLSVVQAPSGSLIVYATAPGEVAKDGEGPNGIFTGALLTHITARDVDVMEMLRAVRRDVMAATGNEQVPWENSSLTGAFYFASGAAVALPDGATSVPRLQATVGEIRITVQTGGQLLLDGERVGTLVDGQSATLQDVPTGRRMLVMDYGGERETVVVMVSADSRATARFEHMPPSELSLETVLVEGGTFQMGSVSGWRSHERPVHSVRVDSFWMTTTEVTFAQYDAFARATGRQLPDDEGWGRGSRPVINVSWYDAVAYANWLSERDGLTSAYQIGGTNVTWDRSANGWRLPTEAEWEYAARGGANARETTYAGSNGADEVAWYHENSGMQTHSAGEKQANELGLYDMSGNVWEWCWDWSGHNYYGNSPAANPAGPSSGLYRVLRGGSWVEDASVLPVAFRHSDIPGVTNRNLGFRLVAPPVQ